MDKMITQQRIGDRIAFFNSRQVEIAQVFDGHNHIIFDCCADLIGVAMDEPQLDYRAIFDEIGLDVATARQIDAMPLPDRNA